LHTRGSNQRGEPAEARHGKAIAERGSDREADSWRLCSDAQIAGSGYASTAARAGPGGRHEGGPAALLGRGQHAVDAGFAIKRMLGSIEGEELVDIGA